MPILLNDDQVQAVLCALRESVAQRDSDMRALDADDPDHKECETTGAWYAKTANEIYAMFKSDNEPLWNGAITDQQYRDAFSGSDELEMDDGALVSRGDDAGAFVQCWSWVPDDCLTLTDDQTLCTHCCRAIGPRALAKDQDELCASCNALGGMEP